MTSENGVTTNSNTVKKKTILRRKFLLFSANSTISHAFIFFIHFHIRPVRKPYVIAVLDTAIYCNTSKKIIEQVYCVLPNCLGIVMPTAVGINYLRPWVKVFTVVGKIYLRSWE